ncbi:phospholipase D-like domain-containing protein [Vibrio sp. CJQ_6]|uniref:phospholipase D-like domain-containing protein n=1 Tax=Vibrio sp. CJQ_6 TaxID=3367165 RepID=UPI00370C32B4
MKNLNEYRLESKDYQLKDNSTIGDNGVEVYFRNLEDKLIGHINNADSVFGAVAWLTSEPILNALSHKNHVQIIVQKEDFLKPDTDDNNGLYYNKKLRKKYEGLSCNIFRGEFMDWLLGVTIMYPNESGEYDDSLEAVRCVGNYNKDKKPAFPRMHNKFLIFADVEIFDDCGYPVNIVKPYAVWTGSFNFSHNATNSFENAVYITDQKVVDAYFNEYTQIAAISEPLDWTSDWIAPQWKL